jgi:4-hydroxybenzoate polyprenyltransferase
MLTSPSQPSAAQTASPVDGVPLCVDLDGTLIKTDTLFESLLCLTRRRPSDLLRVPFWLVRGKAALKRELAMRAIPDVRCLPYREELLAHLRKERNRGRLLILTTGADDQVARAVAAHTELFDEVIASDGRTNLVGKRKLAALSARFDRFDYAGDSPADLPLWKHARRAIVAGASERLTTRVKRFVPVENVFANHRKRLTAMVKALRVHQWVKNLLVFVPAIAAHRMMSVGVLSATLLAFVGFSLCASAGYLLNDMLDLEADRRDPKKQHRPLAAGTMSIRTALLLLPCLLAAGIVLGALVSAKVVALLLLHFVATTVYSLRLKRVAVLDVLILAGLYTLRIFTGAAAGDLRVSPWLIGLSMFMFVSLALVKRASELRQLRERGHAAAPGRGYLTDDAAVLLTLGGASGYMTVVILALYIHSPDVAVLYGHPDRLWFLCPLLLYWFSRIWLLTNRGEVDADPVAFALRDRCSRVLGLVGLVLAYLAR